MKRILKWLNCKFCGSNRIYAFTGGWYCEWCGKSWNDEDYLDEVNYLRLKKSQGGKNHYERNQKITT